MIYVDTVTICVSGGVYRISQYPDIVREARINPGAPQSISQRRYLRKPESDWNIDLLLYTQGIFQTVGLEYDICNKSLFSTLPLDGYLLQHTAPATLSELAACFEEQLLIEAGIDNVQVAGQSFDMVIRLKGAPRWFQLFISPVLHAGQIVKVRGAIMDITDRKQVEAGLDKAEEMALAKQRFLANVSHEIRTPMSAVMGMAHLLLQENPRPEQVENLKTLRFLGENMMSLLNDTLDYCKIDSGKITFERVDFNLHELVHNISRTHNLKATEKGIILKARMDACLPEMVKGDPLRLTQILNNLIGNAIKFTHQGAVTIDIRLNSVSDRCVRIAFSVSDTGIGIDPALQGHIFENFTQAGPDVARHFGGTGLGLSITKRLLDLQGSQIHLESAPGQGAAFSFCLEFQKCGETKVAHNPDTARFNSLTGNRILIVDDHKINAIVAANIMRKWGLETDVAVDGAEALEKCIHTPYDLILMDLQMPVMDGYTSSVSIRALPDERFRTMPIIALTASARKDIKHRLRKAGMADYISKPYSPGELYDKLVRYLR